MNERALIINAIKQKKNTPVVDFEFPEPDVIEKWAKKKKRQESFKGKQIDDWTNVDFLHYLDYMLKEFGVVRIKENTRRDSDKINHLYDKLVKTLTTKMNNPILKEYLEWWCSIWSPRLTGSEFHLNLLVQDYQIERFTSRYKTTDITETVPTITPKQQQTDTFNTINDDSIYDLGGLGLLLMKRGLVISYHILKKRGFSATTASALIQKSIKKFSKEVLVNVFKITLQESPYLESDKVDFISLAISALNHFGLTEYTQISYRDYFKETDENFGI